MNDEQDDINACEIAIDKMREVINKVVPNYQYALKVCVNLLADMIVNASLDNNVDIKALIEEIGKDVTDAVHFKLDKFKKGLC